MKTDFDLVVLGAGSAGYVGAIRAAQLGMKVLVLDPAPLGGTCLHDGCIPTKALLEISGIMRSFSDAGRLGISVSTFGWDPEKVFSFRSGIIDRLKRGIEFLFKKHNISHLKVRGTLIDPGKVRTLGDNPQEIRTRFILLATGSRPRSLPGIPFDGRLVLSSTDILRMKEYGGSVAIIGGGAIGCEFADILSAFGSRVLLLEKESRLLPLEDGELGSVLEKELSGMGIEIHTGTTKLSILSNSSGLSLSYGNDGQEIKEAHVDRVLVAVGREPVFEGLGLETVGLGPSSGGFLPVGPRGETSVDGIYAAGDLTGGHLLAHKASHEAVVAVETMAGLDPRPLDPGLVPRVVYTHPEVVSIGWTKEEAQKKGLTVSEGHFPLMANGRSLIEGQRRGFFKVLSEQTSGRILGFHGIGPHVSEMIGTVAVAMAGKEGAPGVMEGIFPHPTVSEAIHEAFLDLSGRAIHR